MKILRTVEEKADNGIVEDRKARRTHNKRVFPGGGTIDAEVVENSQPINWSSKSNSPKQKEVICHEILDFDQEEDYSDVKHTDGNVESSGKGKEILVNVSLCHHSSANSGPVVGVQSSMKNCPSPSDNPLITNDFGSDNGDDEHMDMEDDEDIDMEDDEDMDMDYDDSLYDDYAVLQSQFDNIDLPPGVEAQISWLPGSIEEKKVSTTTSTSGREASVAPSAPKPLGLNSNGEQNGALGVILKKFRLFKKFDTVEDHLDHHYSKQAFVNRPSKDWTKKIQEEWKILEKDLPDTIFVRVYESRMDLLRAVIIGADGTPYHDGLFFFDVFFPSNYPSVPPHVYYHSFGHRLNPNLYSSGKVCLSLLNTWSGQGKEKWIPGVSTMLQVLVSIQGLILNVKPYFNEPGYAGLSGTVEGEKKSLQYNENIYILNLKTMVHLMKRPPKHFEDFVVGYFFQSAQDILVACKAYMDGAQVGSLVRGGVQDVDESDKSCSQNFKDSLKAFIQTLVDALTQIGAKDCDKFPYLSKKEIVSVPKKT